MTNLSTILHRIGSRGLLLTLVGLLVLAKLGMGLQDTYKADQADLANRQANLLRYQKLTGKAPALRSELERLKSEREHLGKYLFTGTSEDNIISAMQLDLQALVTSAGLESETIRPMKQKNAKEAGGEMGMGEVAIKANLNGTLTEYLAFLAELYNSGKIYRIEAVTLSPYKKSELKILMDLRGYFTIAAPKVAAAAEGAAASAPDEDAEN